MTRPILLTALLFVAASSLAAEKRCEMSRYAELPTTLSTGWPVVNGAINGIPTKFFVQTTTYPSYLSKDMADRLDLRLRYDPLSEIAWIIDRPTNTRLTTVESFSLTGLGTTAVKNIEFVVKEGRYGGGFTGEIGMDWIAAAESEFDLAQGLIRFFRIKNCGDRQLSYWDPKAAHLKLDMPPQSPPLYAATVSVNERPIRAYFDTSAAFSMITLKAAKEAGFDPNASGAAKTEAWSKGGSLLPSWIVRFDSVAIGTERVGNTRIRVVDTSLGHFDMVLGLDFFLSHRIYFSREQKIAYFTHNGGPAFALSLPSKIAGTSTVAAGPPLADAAEYQLRGTAHIARNEFDAAVLDLGEAIKMDANNSEHLRQRAAAYAKLKKYDLAIADMSQALVLQPNDVDLLIDRGNYRYNVGDRAGGADDFRQALDQRPNDSSFELRLARAHDFHERHADAISSYEQWAAKNPKDRYLWTALNQACWTRLTTTKDLEKAIPVCEAAVKADRTSETLDSRGMARLMSGQFSKAIDDYEGALKLRPRSPWSLYGISIAEAKLGKAAQSAKHKAAALELLPTIADEFKRLGVE